jgi:hypothetical protein
MYLMISAFTSIQTEDVSGYSIQREFTRKDGHDAYTFNLVATLRSVSSKSITKTVGGNHEDYKYQRVVLSTDEDVEVVKKLHNDIIVAECSNQSIYKIGANCV